MRMGITQRADGRCGSSAQALAMAVPDRTSRAWLLAHLLSRGLVLHLDVVLGSHCRGGNKDIRSQEMMYTGER